jgi:hypothetical protein
VLPSPNDHDQLAGDPLERSVNVTFDPVTGEVGDIENEAMTFGVTGASLLTVIGCVELDDAPPRKTVSVTLYVPTAAYCFDGFCCVELVPSPNVQIHEDGAPVV